MKKYDLVIYTRYLEPTKYIETSPRYIMPQGISWFRNLPKDKQTLRNCVGFKDFYRNAISLPSPYPQEITWDEAKQAWTNEPPINVFGWGNDQVFVPVIEQHPDVQHGIRNYRHLKFRLPFYVKAPKGHDFLMTTNFWQTQKNVQILNGILEFYHQHEAAINMFVPPDVKQFTIDYGESIAVLLPLSGKKYNIHYEYLEATKFNDLQSGQFYPFNLPTGKFPGVIGMYEKYVKFVKTLNEKRN